MFGFGPGSELLVTPGVDSLTFWSLPDLGEGRTVTLPPNLAGGRVLGEKIVFYRPTSAGDSVSIQVMDFAGEGPRAVATVPRGTARWGASDSEATHQLVTGGRRAALLSLDGTNRLEPLAELPADLADAAPSLRGDRMVASDVSGLAHVWTRAAGSWRLVRMLQGLPLAVSTQTVLDPQGRRLSQAGPNASSVLWDLEAFPDARPLVLGRPGPVNLRVETFDPGGQWLVDGNHARTTVEFWPVASRWRRVLPGFAGAMSLAFSPDSRWLVTCPTFQPVGQWPLKVSDGPVRTLAAPGGGCAGLAIHPEGRQVLVGTYADGGAGGGVLREAQVARPKRSTGPAVPADPVSRRRHPSRANRLAIRAA